MKTQKVKFTVYKARDGYRWNAKRCGRIVAEGGEAYVRSGSCLKSLTAFTKAISAFQYSFEKIG